MATGKNSSKRKPKKGEIEDMILELSHIGTKLDTARQLFEDIIGNTAANAIADAGSDLMQVQIDRVDALCDRLHELDKAGVQAGGVQS